MHDDIPTTGTVTLEPHWPGVRAFVANLWRTGSKSQARDIAASMGCEAPNLKGEPCPNGCGSDHREGCPVGQREEI